MPIEQIEAEYLNDENLKPSDGRSFFPKPGEHHVRVVDAVVEAAKSGNSNNLVLTLKIEDEQDPDNGLEFKKWCNMSDKDFPKRRLKQQLIALGWEPGMPGLVTPKKYINQTFYLTSTTTETAQPNDEDGNPQPAKKTTDYLGERRDPECALLKFETVGGKTTAIGTKTVERGSSAGRRVV